MRDSDMVNGRFEIKKKANIAITFYLKSKELLATADGK